MPDQTPVGQSLDQFVPTPAQDGQAGPGMALAATATVGLGGIAALLWQRRALQFAALGFFTRLVQPTLLDHENRARIAAAVAADPGLTASTIARRLGLPRGVAQYHLLVLEREEMVSCVRTPGFRHYFPLGKWSPQEMRRLALLRHRNAQALYNLIRGSPGIGPTEAAGRLGVPASRVTSLTRLLARGGLVERSRSGRRVSLRAFDISSK